MVITISRQFGSGGSATGRKIAEILGIDCYDGKIIDFTAKESGFDPSYIKRAEQTTTTSFLYNLAINGLYTQPLTDQLFAAESKVIKDLAEKGPCVIIGRCSDYILRNRSDLFNVFVHSTDEFRVARIVESEGVTPEEALSIIKQKDKARRRHYKYYTERIWGEFANYDVCVNTATCGIDNAAEFIAKIVSKKGI